MKKDSNLSVLKRKLKTVKDKDKKGFIMGWIDRAGGSERDLKEALKCLTKK